MLSYLSGFLSAVVFSAIVELLNGGVSKALRWLRMRWASKTTIELDPTRDGLFMLGEWSPTRRLAPHRLATTHQSATERPAQKYVDEAELARTVERRTQDTGHIVYITGLKLDHRESKETQDCRVMLAASDYAEVRAIEEMRMSMPQALASADRALEQNAVEYVKAAVPSSVAINVLLVTEDGELLCAKRSVIGSHLGLPVRLLLK